MSQKYLDALASERQHNAVLRKVMLLVAGLGAIGMFLTYSLPKHLELHVAHRLGLRVSTLAAYGVATDQPNRKDGNG